MTKEKLHNVVWLEAKSVGNDGNGSLEGYASVKNSLDSYGDTIVDGAYAELEALVKDGFVTFGHENRDAPIAYIVEAREDAKGLWVRAEFHGTPEAQTVRQICNERTTAGKSVGLSIDYYVDECVFLEKDGERIRQLTKIRVIGFAIVNVPAERLAEMTAIKGSGRPNAEQFESCLAQLEDWTTREEWIAENRKNGLSAAHIDRIVAIKSRLDALCETKSEAEIVELPIGLLLSFEGFRSTLGD